MTLRQGEGCPYALDPGAIKILEVTSGMPRSRGGLVCQLVLMGLAVAGANKVRRRLL